jgi:hypothetical protein
MAFETLAAAELKVDWMLPPVAVLYDDAGL